MLRSVIARSLPGAASPSLSITRDDRSPLDPGGERRCRGRRAVRLGFDGFPQDLGDVLYLDFLVLAFALHAIVEHDVAERARDRDAGRAGGDGLLAAFGVDLLARALLHPHARAARTAAHAARSVA